MSAAKAKRNASRKPSSAPSLEAILRDADRLRDAKKANDALKLLQGAAKRFPNRWEPRLEIAKIYMSQWSDKSAIQKRLTPALRLLTAHLKKAPKDARAHYELARARYHMATYPRFNSAQADTALRAIEVALPIAGKLHPELYDLRARILLDTLSWGSTVAEDRLATLKKTVAALESAHSPNLREQHAEHAERLRKEEASLDVDTELQAMRKRYAAEDWKGALAAVDRILATKRDRLGHELEDMLWYRATLLDEHKLGTREKARAAWRALLDLTPSHDGAMGRLGFFAFEDFERTKKRALLHEARKLLTVYATESVYPDLEPLYALAKANVHAGEVDDAIKTLQVVFRRRRECAPFRARAKKEALFREVAKTNKKLAKAIA